MALNLKDYQQDKPKKTITTEFKAGTQMGRIVQVINMGLQHQTMWNPSIKQSQKLYWKPKEEQVKGQNNQTPVDTGQPVSNVKFKITVEFPNVRAKDEDGTDKGPAWLSKDYSPKSKELIALAESFDIDDAGKLIGKPVMCPIAFTTGGNAKIKSIAAAPEGVPIPEIESEEKIRVFDYYEPDIAVFNSLYTFIQNEIKEALDYEGSKLSKLVVASEGKAVEKQQAENFGDFDDDIPY